MSMRGWRFPGQGAGSKVKAHKTSGGRKMPVRHTIPLGIVIFLVLFVFISSVMNQRREIRLAGSGKGSMIFILYIYFFFIN